MSDGSTIVVTVQPQNIVVETIPPASIVVAAAEVVVAGVRSINGESGDVEIDFPTPEDVDAKLTGQAVTTDDSYDLPTPTGAGLEFVIVAGALDDIRLDGVSL